MDQPQSKTLLDLPLDVAKEIFIQAGYTSRIKLQSTCVSIRDLCHAIDSEVSVLRLDWSTDMLSVHCHYENGIKTEKRIWSASGLLQCFMDGRRVGAAQWHENASQWIAQIIYGVLSNPYLIIRKLEIDTTKVHQEHGRQIFSEASGAIAGMLCSLKRRLCVKELHISSHSAIAEGDLTLFWLSLDETVLKKVTHYKNNYGGNPVRFNVKAFTGSVQWKNAQEITFWSTPLDDVRDYWNVPILSLRVETISKETIGQLLEHYGRTETFSRAHFVVGRRNNLSTGAFPDLPRDDEDQNTLIYRCSETQVSIAITFLYRSIKIFRI